MTLHRNNIVVVGVDGSDDSLEAVRWADKYAQATNGRIHLVAAWHWPVMYGAPIAYPDGYSPKADAQQALEKAAAEIALSPPRVITSVAEGTPADVLVRASHDADLLVVGSRGHGAVASALLGSVSSHCVHHADIPVVVVRPHHGAAEHHPENRETACHDDYPAAELLAKEAPGVVRHRRRSYGHRSL